MSRKLVAALALLAAAPLVAQEDHPSVVFEGRLQQQFYWLDNAPYSGEAGPRNGFFTRRARIEAQARLSERVHAVIEPSYEGGRVEGLSLKDAFVDILLTEPRTEPPLTLRIGQSKRPFGRYESMSSKNLPSIERGAGMGLVEAAVNDLFDDAHLVGRDIGALLMAQAGRVRFEGGVYNGEGESAPRDVNDAKTYALRLGIEPTGRLGVGAAMISHEGLPDSLGPTVRHRGWGVDIQWGSPGDPGLFLLGEYLTGESFEESPRTLCGGLLVLAYQLLVERDALYAVEPVVRVDLADPDSNVTDDESTLIGGGIGLYLTEKSQLRLLFERQAFADPARPAIAGVRTALAVRF